MIALFIVLIVLAAIAMILIVLVQESKGGGLSSSFSSSNAIMGVRKTTDFVEKATWGLVIFIFIFCIVCNIMKPKNAGIQTEVSAPIQNSVIPNLATKLPAGNTNGIKVNTTTPQKVVIPMPSSKTEKNK